MSSKIKLDYLQILDKDFSVKPNGYDAKEVDLFLDTIIEDYKAYEEINNQFIMLQKANNNLRKKNNDLELEVETLKSKAKDVTTSGEVDFNNVELLKKISQLEEQVYNLERQLREAKESK
jgi:DivIVA domain-containing protein